MAMSSITRWLCAAMLILLALLTGAVLISYAPLVNTDAWFEGLLFSVRNPSLLKLFDLVTYLGNTAVVAGIGGLSVISLWFFKMRRSYAVGLAATLVGAAATGYMMKILVARARPGGLIPTAIETSFSFPSGHALASAALYGFITFFLCKLYPEKKTTVTVVAGVIILIIGFSRLYLGVHFPSDVIAGYLIGGLWLLVGIEVTKRLQDRFSQQ
jgi:undecaprenyl-diphosphatase